MDTQINYNLSGLAQEIQSMEERSVGYQDANGDTELHRVLYECSNIDSYNACCASVEDVLRKAHHITDIRNNFGETPLCLACKIHAHYGIISLLIDNNPRSVNIADSQGMTPLHHLLQQTAEATTAQHMKIVDLLLLHGADINAEDNNGINPLHLAVHPSSGQVDDALLELLLVNGGLLSSPTDLKHAFITVKSSTVRDLIFVSHANDLNKTDDKGWTMLHHLIDEYSGDQDELLVYLIERGAEVEDGAQLMLLLGKKHPGFQVFEKVLDVFPQYINNKISFDGTTLLIRYCGHLTIVKELLKRGADVMSINYIEDHALLNAVKSRNIKAISAIKHLLEGGSDPLLLNKDKKDTLYVVFCNMKKYALIPDESIEDVPDFNPVYEFNEWFKLFKFIINQNVYKNPLIEGNLSLIFFRLIELIADSHTRSIKLIPALEMLHLLLECNDNICSIMSRRSVRSFSNPLMSVSFKDSLVEPITALLLNNSYSYLYTTLVEFIHAMLDAGFLVSETPVNCVTPLTALLIRKYQNNNIRDIESREHVSRLTEEFLVRKVNVGSMALTIQGNFEIIQVLKSKFLLPDALFLSFMNNEEDIVELLISHWWAPPLALLIFKIPVIDENMDLFIFWYTLLSKYGQVPHGTEIHTCMIRHVDYWFEEFEFAYPAGHPNYLKWLPVREEYNQQKKKLLPLRELSKYAVRQMLAARAVQPDANLPALLQEIVAPTLHFLVMHNC